LKAEVVVVDETSMVDTYLMYHLLRAVPAAARLILVGDAHQLPAVGPGNILKDLIDSGVVRVARLTQIYRQAKESLIVVNAHRINRGIPLLPQKFGKDDFVLGWMTRGPQGQALDWWPRNRPALRWTPAGPPGDYAHAPAR
jgi:exodeoxyribonuclease V alpha subunit